MTNSTSCSKKSTEGGFLNGIAPLQTDISLLIIQILLILSLSRALGYFTHKYLKQPRVIAEVIAGILLGPTACGHIPGFTNTIFPCDRISLLKLLSDLGLIFFLFIVGLELDLSLLKTNAKKALWISLVGMIIPFGIGAAVAVFLKEVVMTYQVTLGSIILFIGVAFAITAFPVLARILTETKLLSTPVGIVTISAAAVGDAAAWCLLALTVAIVSAKDPVTSVYIFLMLISFCILMGLFGIFVLRRIQIPEDPSQNLVMLSLIICLIAAWITDIIGVHAIFGAFIAGVIMPRKQGFAVHLTEKIEDLVTIIFLPLYFAYSGLNTNIGLLNSGFVWAGVILVIGGACVAKITSAMLAAKIVGLKWRESFAIGVLMNTKGLVELIVLNIGLQNKVIDESVFTIMVLMALVTTFMTTPLVKFIYPHKFQSLDKSHENLTDYPSKEIQLSESEVGHLHVLLCIPPTPSVVPLLLNFVQILSGRTKKTHQKIILNTAQMIQVTDRYSSVLMATNPFADETLEPLIDSFGSIEGVKLTNQKVISTPEYFPEDLVAVVTTENIDAMFFPWQLSPDHDVNDNSTAQLLFETLRICPCSSAILINPAITGILNAAEAKILIPYFGGPHDREALELGLSFGLLTCIVRYKSTNSSDTEADVELAECLTHLSEKDPSIIYSVREFNDESDDPITAIKEELKNNRFSLIVMGRSEGLEMSENSSDVEKAIGRIPAGLIVENIRVDMVVVTKGENSANFFNLRKGMD